MSTIRLSIEVPCRDSQHEIVVEITSWGAWKLIASPCLERLGPTLGRLTECAQHIQQPNSEVRVEVVRLLEELGEEAVPVLIEALSDEDENVRYQAVVALRRIGSSLALPDLKETLETDWDGEVRLEAFEAIVSIGADEETLLRALRNEYWGVRQEACEVAPSLLGERAVPALCKLLREEDYDEVKEVACKALGVIGDPAAIPTLKEVLENSPECEAALWALERIGVNEEGV